MLELAVLGLLKEQELHGYELKKRLAETLGVASGVSFGSLYPALARLERAGALRTVDQAPVDRVSAGRVSGGRVSGGGPETRPAIPLTGSLGGELAAWRARAAGTRPTTSRAASGRGGRSRKVYGITPQGDELFEVLLAAEQTGGDDSRLFRLRLAFARHLSGDARLGMLERRRAHLLDRLSRVPAGSRPGRRVDGYLRSLMDHDRETTEHDLSWIEQLIAAEHRSPPAVPAVPYLAAAPTLSRLRPSTPLPSAGAMARTNQEESSR